MDTSNSWERILGSVSPSEWANGTREETLRGHSGEAAKRAFDVVVAMAGMTLLSPLMLALAIAVKLESRGSVLYVSRRMGRGGRVFRCLKFRTRKADGQATRLGSILCRHGLDELPQLANVLRGEMSLVGPRPVMAPDSPSREAGRFRRFDLAPGMTGLWAMQQAECSLGGPYVSVDETYRRNWSLRLDLVIVMRSLGMALVGKGR
jgi:lipopolysaccharide/colanic/teichoic acid biosynthesis glycosyltransferase